MSNKDIIEKESTISGNVVVKNLDVSDAVLVVEKTTSNDIKTLTKAVKKAYRNKGIAEQKEKWEDLDAIFNECAKGLITIAENVNQFVYSIREFPSNLITNETSVVVSGLAKDLETFSKDLAFIHNRHIGRSGSIKTEEEHALAIHISIDYMNFNDRFITVTAEPLITLTEQLLLIKDKYQAEMEKKEAENNKTNDETNGGVVNE